MIIMKHAWPYGVLIGVLSAVWIFVIQSFDLHDQEAVPARGVLGISFLEYLSVLIPFSGLFLGIRKYKKTRPNQELTFFRAFVQGFMILLVGGVLAGLATSILLEFSHQPFMDEYIGRMGGALLVGILLNLAVSLWFFNTPKEL